MFFLIGSYNLDGLDRFYAYLTFQPRTFQNKVKDRFYQTIMNIMIICMMITKRHLTAKFQKPNPAL